MNGVDFPVSRVLDGIAAAREAGLAPIKINTVVRRGMNEASILPLARWARDEGLILRFIEYMDVGHSNGWRLDDVVPGRGDPGDDRRRAAARARRRELPRRGGRPLPVPRRRRRARRDRLGLATVLRGLHARATVGRGTPLHVPVRGRRGRTSRRRSGPARRTRSSRRGSRRSGACAPTATRSCAARRPSACRRWRCSPSGASLGSAPAPAPSSPPADARGAPRPCSIRPAPPASPPRRALHQQPSSARRPQP